MERRNSPAYGAGYALNKITTNLFAQANQALTQLYDFFYSRDLTPKKEVSAAELDSSEEFYPTMTPVQGPDGKICMNCELVPTHDENGVKKEAPTYVFSFDPSPHFIPTPLGYPSEAPRFYPSISPSGVPTFVPTLTPNGEPSLVPTYNKDRMSIHNPIEPPKFYPIFDPTTQKPSMKPTYDLTDMPTYIPTYIPTGNPTMWIMTPSDYPITQPTFIQSIDQKGLPAWVPNSGPTYNPSFLPTFEISIDRDGAVDLVPTKKEAAKEYYFSPTRSPDYKKEEEITYSKALVARPKTPSLVPPEGKTFEGQTDVSSTRKERKEAEKEDDHRPTKSPSEIEVASSSKALVTHNHFNNPTI